MGQFLQVTFTSSLFLALVPMMCYSHPNGSKSLLKFPHVVCGEGDYSAMLGLGVPLLIGALGFYAAVICLAFYAPRMAQAGNTDFLQASRFFLFRFRPDCWWWGLVLMARATMMSLAPVVATDDSRVQMLIIIMTLATTLSLQVYFWPWKVPLLNLLDATISVCLMLIIAIVSSFITNEAVDDLQGSSKAGFSVMLLFLVGLLYSSCAILVFMAVSALWFKGPLGSPSDAFLLRQAPDPELLSILFHQTAEKIAKLPPKSTEKIFSALPIYDLTLCERIVTLVEQAGALPGSGRISWSTRSSSIRASITQHSEDQSALPVVLGQSHEPQYDEQMKPTRSDVSADVEQTEVQ